MSTIIIIPPEKKEKAVKIAKSFCAWFRRILILTKSKISLFKSNKRAVWVVRYAAKWALVILSVVLYTILIHRAAYQKAMVVYEGWMEEYKAEQIALAEEKEKAAPVDPYEAQLDAEAELLARVLYGVKDNDNDDLRTYCWCVFNRVDNNAFASTLEDVIAQPNQWMRYDQTNPIIENLYQLAREQLDDWHTNTHRPCSADYVFMSWSKNDICLRDNFYEGSGCHYWRYGQ